MLKFKIDGFPYYVPDVITIGTYSKIYKIKDLFTDDYFAAKLISTVTEAPLQDLLDCPFEDISYISNYIMETIPKTEQINFKDRFELDGVHYGFFPNWRDLSFAEYIDLDTLSTKKPDEILDVLHILAAIMYRPITNEISEHNFEIESYDVNTMGKRSELFKNKLDVRFILGAQFFFIKFAERLLNYIPPSLTQTNLSIWKKITLIWKMWRMIYKIPSKGRSGGFWSSTKLLTMILQNMNTSIKRK
jgi:hypothetical protein